MSYQPLKGQTALVTGASSGIGAGVALALAAAGADVVVNYASNSAAADEIAGKIVAGGTRALAIKADAGDETQVEAMFDQMIAAWGRCDILVNNAGLQQDAAFTDMTLAQWNRVINTNLTGMFLCSRRAVKEMLRVGPRPGVSAATGKIVCMSSVHEIIPWAGHVNYAASKGGVKLFMQSLSQELAPQKIRVNSIGPGAIQTPINRAAWDTPEALEKLLELIPYGRIGQPADIGKAAVWLASDDSDYVNGQTIFVCGGMTLYPEFADGG
ncbi:MAG: glucose 1-dehydrogenase [Gammaproteobacteria bacterium]|jgi:glucose 1-dehydrogenase|nr:glucose 1-dehydrogenase [Gammaproteobacteria bacterium]